MNPFIFRQLGHKNKQTEGQTGKSKLHIQTTANYNTRVQTMTIKKLKLKHVKKS